MPRCSIVIPVFNRANLTRQCLDRLLADPAGSDFEVIVVDNASRDGTRQMLSAYGERIRVRSNERNLFFATACNQGAEMARGEYLVFLNNDTVPLGGWLDALVRHAETHGRAGLVAGKLLYPNGTVQHAGMAICQDGWPRLIYVGFPADHPAVSRSRRMQVVSGACNLVPRKVFYEAGGFDPSYVNGFEDVDLCLRLGGLGYEVHFCHESVLFHLESVSEGRFDSESQNAAVFLRRWAGKVQPDDLQIYLADGLVRVDYGANHLGFEVAPELGAVTSGRDTAKVSGLLALRAQQVYSLLRRTSPCGLSAPAQARGGRHEGGPRVLHRHHQEPPGRGPRPGRVVADSPPARPLLRPPPGPGGRVFRPPEGAFPAVGFQHGPVSARAALPLPVHPI